jgi:membrane protease YdiL (CAAX protease family)/protein-S-isoprenylcysteine O-methyltransferase Ste14
MALETIEQWLGWIGGAAVLVTLGVIFYGIFRGIRRPQQANNQPAARRLRQPVFYAAAGLGYFGLCYLLWKPLGWSLSPGTDALVLVAGTLVFFGGLALVLWGRLTLGKWYYVSTSFGAPLYVDHQLVTGGPFALVRHPMYLGILMVGLGGILLYRTWTLVFVALNFLGLMRAYCRRVPRWLPRLRLVRFERAYPRITPGLGALLEVLILFLPAIPAYLWIWPVVQGATETIFQILVYVYMLTGALWIGLRRWNLAQLGLNRKGIWLSLACALVILVGRLMIVFSVKWTIHPASYNLIGLLGQVLYYFGLVGLVEELLFRGLVYRAFEEWLGSGWAIWGSAFGFMLWHIFGQGLLIGVTTFVIGLAFALIRWRAGGILGLIVLHGLYDLETVLLVSDSNAQIANLSRPEIPYPGLTILGLVFMLAIPFYLGKLYLSSRTQPAQHTRREGSDSVVNANRPDDQC